MKTLYQNFSLYHHLKKCIVGKSWPAEFYSNIKDKNVRSDMETIAVETEEGYQNLIKTLNTLGVEVVRPVISENLSSDYLRLRAPNSPGDYMIMLGDKFVEAYSHVYPNLGKNSDLIALDQKPNFYNEIFQDILNHGNEIISLNNPAINNAMITQLGNTIYFSSWDLQDRASLHEQLEILRPNSQINFFYLPGHIDGWFCPVGPGFLVSSTDPNRSSQLALFYKTYFPDWEVFYIDPTLYRSEGYKNWRSVKNNTKWWVRNHENNFELQNFIKTYMEWSLGNVEETVFEVNMLVVDQKTIIIDRYNERLFQRLSSYGVNPYICSLKHSELWDSSIHCSVCEIHRTNGD